MILQFSDYCGNYLKSFEIAEQTPDVYPAIRFLLCKHPPPEEVDPGKKKLLVPSLEQRRMQRVCFESQRLPLFDSFSKTTVRKLDFLNSFISVTIENHVRQTEPESESWVNLGGGKLLIPQFSLIAQWNVHRARRISVFLLLTSP